jgi:hypothetical protein
MVPEQKPTRAFPLIQGGYRNAKCFLVEYLKRDDGTQALGLDISPTMLAPQMKVIR